MPHDQSVCTEQRVSALAHLHPYRSFQACAHAFDAICDPRISTGAYLVADSR